MPNGPNGWYSCIEYMRCSGDSGKGYEQRSGRGFKEVRLKSRYAGLPVRQVLMDTS